MAAEEIEIMGRYCDGDASAFRLLYERLAPRLMAYLMRLARDRAAAEDLLQLTFLKVHRARAAYVRDADPVPWIYAIAHRSFLDHARKSKRARVRLAHDADHVPEGRAHISGKAETDVRPGPDPELARAALDALDELPASQREAVVLTKLQGKSVREAAEIAGTTPGAMKVRAHRGYARLRTLLAGRDGGDTDAGGAAEGDTEETG